MEPSGLFAIPPGLRVASSVSLPAPPTPSPVDGRISFCLTRGQCGWFRNCRKLPRSRRCLLKGARTCSFRGGQGVCVCTSEMADRGGSGERARGSEARPPVPGWWGWQCPRPGFWGAVAGPTSFKNLDSLHPPHTPKVFPVDGGRGGFFPTFLSLGVDGAGDSRELWCQVPPGRSQTRQQRGERRRRGPNLPGRRARPGPQVFGDCCARISFYLPRTPRSGHTGHAYSAAEDSVFRDRPGPVSGTPRVGGS